MSCMIPANLPLISFTHHEDACQVSINTSLPRTIGAAKIIEVPVAGLAAQLIY